MGDFAVDLVALGGAAAAGIGETWPIRARPCVTKQRWGTMIGYTRRI